MTKEQVEKILAKCIDVKAYIEEVGYEDGRNPSTHDEEIIDYGYEQIDAFCDELKHMAKEIT